MPSGVDAGAFAFVMATGIVSVAAADEGLPILSDALLAIACAAWAVLAAAVSRRALVRPRGRPRLQAFAVVAATSVIGVRLVEIGSETVALVLWSVALGLWILLLLQRVEIGRVRGSSLLVVVATESLAVLAALLAPNWSVSLLLVAVAAWLLGLVLYPLVLGALVPAVRRRRRFEPDLWIVMGALAITTLAGSELLLGARRLSRLGVLRTLLPGVDLAVWAAAAALIPPLLAAELLTRSGWRYEEARWSFVFPLGMFSAASRALARADALPALAEIARVFFVGALAAWSVVLIGLARHAIRRIIPSG